MSPLLSNTYQVNAQLVKDDGTGRFTVPVAQVAAVDFEDAISRFCKSMERAYREGGLIVSNTEDFLVEVYDQTHDTSKVYSVELNVQFAVDFEASDVAADPHDPEEEAENPHNQNLPEVVKEALKKAGR